MDVKGFQAWLSAASGLARAQRREALAVLLGRSEGEASKAAIEGRVPGRGVGVVGASGSCG